MSLLIESSVGIAQNSPLHKHGEYEIILFTRGQGRMLASGREFPFSEGTIIVMPPQVPHRSISVGETERIYVRGDFHNMLQFDNAFSLSDNKDREGTLLARMLLQNRYGNEDYLNALSSAYLQFILHHSKIENNMRRSVNEVIRRITEHFSDGDFSVARTLNESGYAQDYIRACFKEQTGKTPNGFLNNVRIRHARFLIETYGNSLSLAQIAEQCGFTDYVYFSKKFKQETGISPRSYLRK